MMQRIEVNNFGPLKNISLDIKDYMIFIGPQASGKSTLAKLVWYWKEFENTVVNFYQDLLLNEHRVHSQTSLLQAYWRRLEYPESWWYSDTLIHLIFQEKLSIQLGREGVISQSSEMISLLKELGALYEHLKNSFNASESTDERLIIAKNLRFEIRVILKRNGLVTHGQNIFVPATRGIYALSRDYRLGTNPYAQLRSDDFLHAFFLLIKEITDKVSKNTSEYFGENEYTDLVTGILKGEIKFDSVYFDFDRTEKGLVPKIDIGGRTIDLENASSGQQESLWIILMIIYFWKNRQPLSLIVEEPEAHLFPEAQRDLIYLISLLANEESNQVLLTTHSPYILASLNNLLKAYTVGQVGQNREAVSKIISPLLWVNPERVFVGYMESGGITPILNQELQQIEHDSLDSVSNDIMSKFDELLEIQYNQ